MHPPNRRRGERFGTVRGAVVSHLNKFRVVTFGGRVARARQS